MPAANNIEKQLWKKGNSRSNRVNRGGSWNNNARNCRVSNRNNNTPDNRNNNLGLRLAVGSLEKMADAFFVNRLLSCRV
ncbi:MAG: SUMF1/EgtB/PvdO family nonheme iron enzyme [Coprobacter sp.]|nr:SUMF1/EgtB/PvdO family nonheme iron enzyme [Coprobacter sp.]